MKRLSTFIFLFGAISGAAFRRTLPNVLSAPTSANRTSYYPYGEPHRLPQGQPYLFASKERHPRTGATLFGPRNLLTSAIFWSAPDPHSGKYTGLSPWSYCGGNPISFCDPTGYEIKGLTKSDARQIVNDFREIFRDEIFDNFRELIVRSGKKQNGKSLAPISSEAFSQAFSGKTLNEDQQALVEMFVNTINSTSVHLVEYSQSFGNVSENAQRFLGKFFDNKALPLSLILEANGGLPAVLIIHARGGGVTESTKNGSYSLIFNDSNLHPNGTAVTLGHEVIGHGRSLSLGRSGSCQHVDAIRTENLILRVMMIPYVNNGANHGPKTIIESAELLPDFR